MADYTTIAKVEAYTLKDIGSSFETNVSAWITSISRFIDQYCNRTIVASGSDTEKYYDGEGKEYVSIDECQSITTVELGDRYGDNLSAVTDYIKYPATAPHRALILKSGVFTGGIQNVKVTADFGYAASTPEDIEFAATVLVAGIINAQDPNAQGKKSERIGNYQVTYTDDKGITDFNRAMAILDSHKRYVI